MNDRELPRGELDRIDDAASRATDEQGGAAGDAVAHAGMGLELTPPGLRAVWGRIVDPYTAEGESVALYLFEQIVHDGNAPAAVEGGLTGVALDVDGSLDVPAGAAFLFWPSEDALAGASGEKFRFSSGLAAPGDTFDYTDVTFNYTDVTYNYVNVTTNIFENYVWYVEGPGHFIVEAPFTVCSWMYWCYFTYLVETAQLDDWVIPSTEKKVVIRLTSSADFVITGMVPAGTTGALTRAPSSAAGAGWVDPANVSASDDARATCALAAGATSGALTARDFGFDVPAHATILGFTVAVERSKAGGGVVSNTEVQLLKAGVAEGAVTASGADWPGVDATLTLGGAASLWGGAWAPEDVNDPDFGLTLEATEGGTAAVTLRVDAITVTVTYRITDGGQVVVLANCSDTSVMTLAHDSTSATAHRFLLEGNVDGVFGPEGCALCWYDPASQRWRVIGGGGGADADELVKVSPDDTTPDYLENKITSTGGTVTITEVNEAGNETLNLEVSSSAADDHKVMVSADDTTPDYLENKCTSTGGTITITETAEGGDEKLNFEVAGGGGGPTTTNGQTIFTPSYTPTAVFANIGLSAALPSAGTYLLTFTLNGSLQTNSIGDYLQARLYDSTAAAAVAGSTFLFSYLTVASVLRQGSISVTARLVVAGATTVDVQAQRQTVGVVTSASIGTGTLVWTKIA